MQPEIIYALVEHPAVRPLAAFLLCSLIGLTLGNRAVGWLRVRFREPIKSISPTVMRLHGHKAQTPTMGGIFIVAGVLLGSMACGSLADVRVLLALLAMAGFAVVGAVDDLVKLRTSSRGISAGAKLAGQFCVAIPLVALLAAIDGTNSPGSLLLNVLVLVGAANAVNVTDGLDGLAAGCGLIASVTFTLLLVVVGISALCVPVAALAGSLAAFVWFNRHPARVFMGDTGSQAIGGLLAFVAIAAHQELVFAIVCGIFLVEAASVVVQLGSYRLRGRRLLLCAPLHHHFQFAGWHETKIVRRFWAAAIAFSVAGAAVPLGLSKNLAKNSGVTAGNLPAGVRVSLLTHSGEAPSRPARVLVAQQESSFP